MTLRHCTAGALAVAATVLLASGCGTKCPTESPAQISALGSCTTTPGGPVSVPVRLCPTCNQTGATCQVDTSQASSGTIQLDPTVEACDNVSSCGTPSPTCETNPLTCSFTAPTTPGTYTILVVDGAGRQTTSSLDVATNVTPSCSNI